AAASRRARHPFLRAEQVQPHAPHRGGASPGAHGNPTDARSLTAGRALVPDKENAREDILAVRLYGFGPRLPRDSGGSDIPGIDPPAARLPASRLPAFGSAGP